MSEVTEIYDSSGGGGGEGEHACVEQVTYLEAETSVRFVRTELGIERKDWLAFFTGTKDGLCCILVLEYELTRAMAFRYVITGICGRSTFSTCFQI